MEYAMIKPHCANWPDTHDYDVYWVGDNMLAAPTVDGGVLVEWDSAAGLASAQPPGIALRPVV